MTQTQPVSSTTPAVPRGFLLPCLRCGELGALTLRLDSMTEDDAIHCPECDADYSLSDAQETVAAWSALLAWVQLAPPLREKAQFGSWPRPAA
ncbi:MAG TPA: hypothetical protein VMS17_31570 [Gemmataceae bacterium]|nr:hypothetical protein [Gemmataceae bacterium]